ncbi:MAG: hypothetical protein JST50_12070 [Bacteroidetes bacterium]|nr:hypothetical protein [Bacteroidota bacterium]
MDLVNTPPNPLYQVNIKSIITIIGISAISYSCTDSYKKDQSKTDSAATSLQPHYSTFLDSIFNQANLSFAQIKHHTLIDNVYFTTKSTFTGDTIYYRNSNYPIVILKYNDGLVCSKKILLVYDKKTMKNTAELLVETDCDEDYSTDFSRLSYKIFNNNQFYTREVRHIRNNGKKTKIAFNDRFYHINNSGKIESLNKKPVNLIVPVFDPKGEINDEDN